MSHGESQRIHLEICLEHPFLSCTDFIKRLQLFPYILSDSFSQHRLTIDKSINVETMPWELHGSVWQEANIGHCGIDRLSFMNGITL
jgi:hypothetical protein